MIFEQVFTDNLQIIAHTVYTAHDGLSVNDLLIYKTTSVNWLVSAPHMIHIS